MRRFHLFWLLLVFMSLFGCASFSNRSKGWKKNEVAGLTISLKDPVKEEWYQFNRGGTVAATYGDKKGWLAFPLYSWRIQRGLLQILDDEKSVFQELRLVKREGQNITVINKAGKTVQFTILPK